jgi:hypothetical protein
MRKAWVTRIFLLSVLIATFASCGPADYQKPIQQFQEASSVVIASTKAYLNNVNTTEENARIEQLSFERQPIDPLTLGTVDLITPEEINVRVQALDHLSRYTANLATLAGGKETASVSQKTQDLSKSVQQLAKDAGSLPTAKSTILDNSKFAGAVSAAATAIGQIAQLFAERRARKEIEKAVRDNDHAVTALIDLLGTEIEAAYARQESTLDALSIYLYRAYNDHRATTDSVLMLTLADRLEAYHQHKLALRAADPGPSVAAMKKTHSALVEFVNSDKDPKISVSSSSLRRTLLPKLNRSERLSRRWPHSTRWMR